MLCTQTNPSVLTYENQLFQKMEEVDEVTDVKKKFWKDLKDFVDPLLSDNMDII